MYLQYILWIVANAKCNNANNTNPCCEGNNGNIALYCHYIVCYLYIQILAITIYISTFLVTTLLERLVVVLLQQAVSWCYLSPPTHPPRPVASVDESSSSASCSTEPTPPSQPQTRLSRAAGQQGRAESQTQHPTRLSRSRQVMHSTRRTRYSTEARCIYSIWSNRYLKASDNPAQKKQNKKCICDVCFILFFFTFVSAYTTIWVGIHVQECLFSRLTSTILATPPSNKPKDATHQQRRIQISMFALQ